MHQPLPFIPTPVAPLLTGGLTNVNTVPNADPPPTASVATQIDPHVNDLAMSDSDQSDNKDKDDMYTDDDNFHSFNPDPDHDHDRS